MPKTAAIAAKSHRLSPKAGMKKKGKATSSASMVAVTSHVGLASQLHADFRQIWDSQKNAKVKRVIRDGTSTIIIYK